METLIIHALLEFLESVVALLLQAMVDVLLYLPFDLLVVSRERRNPAFPAKFVVIVICMAVGAGIGGVSVLLYPHAFLTQDWTRVANLVVTPIGTLYLANYFASRRKRKKGVETDLVLHRWCSIAFAVGLVSIRFLYAKN